MSVRHNSMDGESLAFGSSGALKTVIALVRNRLLIKLAKPAARYVKAKQQDFHAF